MVPAEIKAPLIEPLKPSAQSWKAKIGKLALRPLCLLQLNWIGNIRIQTNPSGGFCKAFVTGNVAWEE